MTKYAIHLMFQHFKICQNGKGFNAGAKGGVWVLIKLSTVQAIQKGQRRD
jgi:hypothetical protein